MALRPETLLRLLSRTRTTQELPEATTLGVAPHRVTPDIITKQGFERRWGPGGGPVQAERQLRERARGLAMQRAQGLGAFQEWQARNPMAGPKEYLAGLAEQREQAEKLATEGRAREEWDRQFGLEGGRAVEQRAWVDAQRQQEREAREAAEFAKADEIARAEEAAQLRADDERAEKLRKWEEEFGWKKATQKERGEQAWLEYLLRFAAGKRGEKELLIRYLDALRRGKQTEAGMVPRAGEFGTEEEKAAEIGAKDTIRQEVNRFFDELEQMGPPPAMLPETPPQRPGGKGGGAMPQGTLQRIGALTYGAAASPAGAPIIGGLMAVGGGAPGSEARAPVERLGAAGRRRIGAGIKTGSMAGSGATSLAANLRSRVPAIPATERGWQPPAPPVGIASVAGVGLESPATALTRMLNAQGARKRMADQERLRLLWDAAGAGTQGMSPVAAYLRRLAAIGT